MAVRTTLATVFASALVLVAGAGAASASPLFQPYVAYPVGSWPEAVAIGDVTGDGRNDVVMVTSYYFDPDNDYHVFVFAQTPAGGLAAPVSYATSGTYTNDPTSVDIGDITGDGKNDVVVGLSGLGVEVFPQLRSEERRVGEEWRS